MYMYVCRCLTIYGVWFVLLKNKAEQESSSTKPGTHICHENVGKFVASS